MNHAPKPHFWIVMAVGLILVVSLACALTQGIMSVTPTSASSPMPDITPLPTETVISSATVAPTQSPTTPVAARVLRPVMPEEGLPWGKISAILSDHLGRIWVSGLRGVYRYENGVWSVLYDQAADFIIGQDAVGRVWVLVDGGQRIASFGGKEAYRYGPTQGWSALAQAGYLSQGFGDGLANDNFNRVWLATGRDDLRRFDPQTGGWRRYTASEIGFAPAEDADYQGHFLTDVLRAQDGTIWVSDCIGQGEILSGQGVRRFDGSRWQAVSETADQCVYDMEIDANGRVWISAFDEVIFYDPQKDSWIHYTLPVYGRRQVVTSIDLDPSGAPWIEVLRAGGASIYGSTVRYHLKEGEWVLDFDPQMWLPSSLAFGIDGQAWLCAGGVLYQMTDSGAQPVGELRALSCQVKVDGSGRVWVASYNGADAGLWYYQP